MVNRELNEAIDRIKAGIKQARDGLIDRGAVTQAILLGAIAGEHLLAIGPPGTAKSTVVRRVAATLGGSYFEYLLGKFTEPSELFGTIDFTKLKEGRFETQTAGMLPEADFVFLDEIFLASTAILNTLLGILNDRRFRRGHTQLPCPLKICVGASNHLPEEETLAAFADRFLLTCFIHPIADARLETLLTRGWALANATPPANLNLLHDIDLVSRHLSQVDIAPIVSPLADAIRTLRSKGISLSDRRITKLAKLIAASALLDGRMGAQKRDFWPLVYAVQDEEQQEVTRTALADYLAESRHSLFDEAAYQAAGTLSSLSAVLIGEGEQLLASYHNAREQKPAAAWRTEAEALLKQIDAGFAATDRPEKLESVRTLLVEMTRDD